MKEPVTRLNAALANSYRIKREIGVGGMATVYLAADLRHERDVALKVLRPELAAVVGAERFLAEIKTTANLQHPHILPLFDSGEADGFLYYVMPFVHGETLRERLDREKQLPIDEAVGITQAMVGALDYAHRNGVIHRDIKPANVLLQEGQPVIADFGIALAVGSAAGARLTETGLSVGTPFYMSPEQATGEQFIGPGSDIYSTAAVLYELLTGEPPYSGATAQAVLGRILSGEPKAPSSLRPRIPPNVDAAIQKGLERLPADRFTAASDFGRALEDGTFRHGGIDDGQPNRSANRWRAVAIAAAAVAVLQFVAGGIGFGRGESPPNATEPEWHRVPAFGLHVDRPIGKFTALAPDGSSMVFAESPDEGDTWNLWLKTRNSADARLIPGTEQGQNPAYSPDSQWIVFVSGSVLMKLRLSDGFSVPLARELGGNTIGLAWLDDGTVVYEAPGNVLVRISDMGGGTADTLSAYGEHGVTQLAFAGALPGSPGVLVTLCGDAPQQCGTDIKVAVFDFAADTTKVLLEDVNRGWYVEPGFLVYVTPEGAVFAAPFDLEALAVSGPEVPLFGGVRVSVSTPELVIGADGTALFAPAEAGVIAALGQPVWVDRTGDVTPVDGMTMGVYSDLSISNDDDRIAMVIADEVSADGTPLIAQIWVAQLPDGPRIRLTNERARARRPTWLPDGRSIAYINTTSATTADARRINADGTELGAYDPLFETPFGLWEFVPNRDASQALYRVGTSSIAGSTSGLGIADLVTGSRDSLVMTEFNEHAVGLSPDERWFAYQTDASGQYEVVVRPFPAGDALFTVSRNGGISPVWSENGRDLFFIDGDGWLVSASYVADPTFRVTGRTRLFQTDPFSWRDRGWRVFDVTSDDERFLFVQEVQPIQRRGPEFVLVHDFFEEVWERSGG